jgi:hypothetical protein
MSVQTNMPTQPLRIRTTATVAVLSCVGYVALCWWLAAIGDETSGGALLASWALGIFGIVTGCVLTKRKHTRSSGLGLAIGFAVGSLVEAIMFLAFLSWLGTNTA